MAEALLRKLGTPRFQAFSAGSHSKGELNPLTISTLRDHGFSADGFRSKSWDEFAHPGAQSMDLVITVCDQAAGEICPIWPGAPLTAHWSIADPAAVEGTAAERANAFVETMRKLEHRIRWLVELPSMSWIGQASKRRIDEIGCLSSDASS